MHTSIVSFDGTECLRSEVHRPDRYRHLFQSLHDAPAAIPRGAGLSYCSASAGENVRSVSGLAFNRILDFCPATGQIEVEPGIRLGDLYRFLAPRGWMLAILPGHPSISVGGCIGCNVHGKNHVRDGSFVNVIERLRLFHPDHGELECSRDCNLEVFHLTVGGFGLTGFVTSVRLQLRRLSGTAVQVRRQPIRRLVDALELLETHRQADVLYSWHDFNARGAQFGRGFVYVGQTIESCSTSGEIPLGTIEYRCLNASQRGAFRLGPFVPWITRTAARIYGLSQHFSPSEKTYDLASASFPINGKEIYFKLFGRQGFREYQMLIPRARWPEACDGIRELIARHQASIGLASLKLFDSQGALLRFDGRGICLSLDAPASERTIALFEQLDRLTERMGGLVNLSKDSRLSAGTAEKLFPEYTAFRTGIRQFDPRRRFDSSLRRRLDV